MEDSVIVEEEGRCQRRVGRYMDVKGWVWGEGIVDLFVEEDEQQDANN